MSYTPDFPWALSPVSQEHFEALAAELGIPLEQYLYIWFNGLSTGLMHHETLYDFYNQCETVKESEPFLNDIVKNVIRFQTILQQLYDEEYEWIEKRKYEKNQASLF